MLDFKKDIILPAWQLIHSDAKVKKFYFLPGILSIIFMTVMLVYQSIYTYIVIAGKKNEALELILKFFEKDYFLEIAVIAVIFLLMYIFLTPIFEWALIKYIEQKDTNDSEWEVSASDVLWVGLFKFLPVFEYDQMFNKFKTLSILNFYLFTIRIIWEEYLYSISIVYMIILLFGVFINMFFSYAKLEIVLANKWVFASIWSSAKITILNLKLTIKLYFLIFILNIRIILNFILLLIFPLLIAFSIVYITSQIFLFITITLLSLFFIALIAFLSYLSSVLEVFTTSLWYHAWKQWKEKLNSIEK